MIEKIFGNKKILFVIDIILLIISIKAYKYIYDFELTKNAFVNETIKFVEENKNPVFRVNKIILYNSAYAVDKSQNQQLQNINISQFTDIAIYIDNKSKINQLNAENTVNEMFIDNIKLNINSEKGEHIINYKNPKEFGKYSQIENYSNDGILLNIVRTNEEMQNADFNNNLFYTDCSNPVTLGVVNRNLLKNCKINNMNGKLTFDGSILKNAKVDLNSISGEFSFTIHIKNNLGEDFMCKLNIENILEDREDGIYSGYVMKILNTEGDQYNFLKVSS